MLFNLFAPLADEFTAFNLFRYLTFRSGGAVMTALAISFVMGPRTIRWLKKKQRERLRESIRKEVGEAEMGSKVERGLWEAATAGLVALATALAQSSARRFFSEPPRGTDRSR